MCNQGKERTDRRQRPGVPDTSKTVVDPRQSTLVICTYTRGRPDHKSLAMYIYYDVPVAAGEGAVVVVFSTSTPLRSVAFFCTSTENSPFFVGSVRYGLKC